MLTWSDILSRLWVIMSERVSSACFYSPKVNIHPKPRLWKILPDHWLIMHGKVHLFIKHHYLPCCWIEIGQQKVVLKHQIMVRTRGQKRPFGCSPHKDLRNSGLHSVLLSKFASESIMRLAAWESHKRTAVSQNTWGSSNHTLFSCTQWPPHGSQIGDT